MNIWTGSKRQSLSGTQGSFFTAISAVTTCGYCASLATESIQNGPSEGLWESMLDAGLLPDDCVVVLREATAAVGDIVVALVDREYTIKYLAEDDNGLYLKPSNKEYKEIRPTDSLEIFGVVTGSFRSYNPRRAA